METTEELNALLASIEEEVSSETPVYLHLPAVTYDGDIVFGNHVWGIFSRFCIHLTGNFLFCKFFPRQFSSLLIQNIQLTWKGTLHSLCQCISTFTLGMSC